MIFQSGVPTEPDVKRLIEAFPKLVEGQTIAYQDIEVILGIDRKQSRYRTVTTAWRRAMLRVHNIEIEAVKSLGFRVMPPNDRLTGSVKRFGRGVRAVGRSVGTMRRVPAERLSEEQQRVYDHASRRMQSTLDHARGEAQSIAAVFRPQEQLQRGPAPVIRIVGK